MSESSQDYNWKDDACQYLAIYYQRFNGTQWDIFNAKTDSKLLRAKICFAWFGPPKNEADYIEHAYDNEQQQKAQTIVDKILHVYNKGSFPSLQVGFIFVACKQDDNNVVLSPIFSLFVGTDKFGNDKRNFFGTDGRVYQDWDDWKKNNTLPKCEYAYPTLGYFTCSGNDSYMFDPNKKPDIEYGQSPQSSLVSKTLRLTDFGTGVLSIGIGIAAVFAPVTLVNIPLAAAVLRMSTIYGAGRAVHNLNDKRKHGQSVTDRESLESWLSIAVTPLDFLRSFVNGKLVLMAQEGKDLCNKMKITATVLNYTTVGVDSFMISIGFVNLIWKFYNKEQTKMDFLHFSMSVFFFTNNLIQPISAEKYFTKAQEHHFERTANSMSDETAKEILKKFLDRNKSRSSTSERAKMIRTLNKIEDPSKFFKSVGLDATINVEDDQGNTVSVGDQHGFEQKVQPNKYSAMSSKNTNPPKPVRFNKDYNKLEKCYGRKPEDVKLNGVNIFKNLNETQKRCINRTVRGTAKFNKLTILTAHEISEKMKYDKLEDLMSVIEIVAKEVDGKVGDALTQALHNIQRGNGHEQFISNLKRDLKIAAKCAKDGSLHFDDPFKAVYHYRKHGADFPEQIKKFGDTMDVYIGPVKNELFDSKNLRETCTLENGIVRHIYVNDKDQFGVVTSTKEGVKISTMFKKPGKHQEYRDNFADYFKNHEEQPPPEPISDTADRIAKSMGQRSFQLWVINQGDKQPYDRGLPLDASVHEEIARLLTAIADEL